MSDTKPELLEAQFKIKVNSRGEKRRKMQCPKGYKVSPSGSSCVPITGAEKTSKRLSIVRSVRTKKQGGAGYQTKVNRKRLKAMKRRKSLGL